MPEKDTYRRFEIHSSLAYYLQRMGVCGIYCWGLAQKHPTQAKHQHIQNDLQGIVIDTRT